MMRTLLVLAVVAVLLFFGAIMLASEQGGEVVTLRTTADGEIHETRLWIVEIGPDLWLRAGDPASGWLVRLRENPSVGVERRGETARYRATAVPHMGPEVDARMAERYGWADRLIGIIRSEGKSIAVRLDPEI
jgi:hypothetical protein